MANFICSLSNEPTFDPVLSPISGHIFDRRLILKYIEETGRDPMTDSSLEVGQLIDFLKFFKERRHSVQLRQQLQAARQELSHALYQHDAACRVIARLQKEVTAAREALATLKPPSNDEHSSLGLPIPSNIVNRLDEEARILTQSRRKRSKKPPETWVQPDDIRSFKCSQTHVGLHSASSPGILCIDLNPTDFRFALTGGADKLAIVFDLKEEQVLQTLKGHSNLVRYFRVRLFFQEPSTNLIFYVLQKKTR
ncbi:hypothetical protein ACOME3_001827 [Neoechinorhynchus agilis]